jgi:hypothetical protein
MIRLLAHPRPTSCQQLVSLSQSYCVLPVELADGREGGGRGAKLNDRDKAFPSINHSILSGLEREGAGGGVLVE